MTLISLLDKQSLSVVVSCRDLHPIRGFISFLSASLSQDPDLCGDVMDLHSLYCVDLPSLFVCCCPVEPVVSV